MPALGKHIVILDSVAFACRILRYVKSSASLTPSEISVEEDSLYDACNKLYIITFAKEN